MDYLTEVDWHQNNSTLIVPIALEKYFLEGIPVEETIINWTSIWEFFIKVKAGGNFYYELTSVIDGKLTTKEFQKNNRYLITNRGGVLKKSDEEIRVEEKEIVNFFGQIEEIDYKKVKKAMSFAEKHPQQGKTWYITVYNQVDSELVKDYDINFSYYIYQCSKIIDKFNLKQIKIK